MRLESGAVVERCADFFAMFHVEHSGKKIAVD